ncbi:uncharacterized protein CANTADRAFT_19012 [Suhomyces tanzawaensis NRRL Y-17324]|uniref:C2H2-type domain-containing protein n=1 Tax=Suhomyces tanzawaensis NRRL Y-17324 TaxID=984487 RepID=A0A1E4SPB0_9ASCO|nr:uncharacterized protein CANTADRAFT_19012 [Suhomyces tanzawaensis NRRL Y-17324]ODV81370.1 hypothetical protein CANTADRAFT_19012 [Suhomyces tanzawaensis NRRL Y-17324]
MYHTQPPQSSSSYSGFGSDVTSDTSATLYPVFATSYQGMENSTLAFLDSSLHPELFDHYPATTLNNNNTLPQQDLLDNTLTFNPTSGLVRDNINLQLKLGQSYRQNSPMNQYFASLPGQNLFAQPNKRLMVSPVVVSSATGGQTLDYNMSTFGLQPQAAAVGAVGESAPVTPPTSPEAQLFLDTMYDNMGQATNNSLLYNMGGDGLHDGFFNYDFQVVPASNVHEISPKSYGGIKADPISMSTELSIVEEQQRQLQIQLQKQRCALIDNQVQNRHKKKRSSTKTEVFDATPSLDVTTAIDLAAKAFTKAFPQRHSSVNILAHGQMMPMSPTSSTGSSISTPLASSGFKATRPMKDRLLEKFSRDEVLSIKYGKVEMECGQHCSAVFQDFIELAEHYDEHKIIRYCPRSFICPIDDCPMNILGYNKKALLKQHVVSHHFAKGYVKPELLKYSQQLLSIVFVCEHSDCKKGFYRRDSLTRHLKLVHANASSKFNLKKRERIEEEEEEEDCGKKRRRRSK